MLRSRNFRKKAAEAPPTTATPEYSSTGVLNFVSLVNDWEGDDLNNAAHPPTANYAGDFGANGPHATAMGFHWLEKVTPEISFGGAVTVRETLEELSGLMNRADTSVTSAVQLISGKLHYIDQKKIPVTVGYQSWWVDDAYRLPCK